MMKNLYASEAAFLTNNQRIKILIYLSLLLVTIKNIKIFYTHESKRY